MTSSDRAPGAAGPQAVPDLPVGLAARFVIGACPDEVDAEVHPIGPGADCAGCQEHVRLRFDLRAPARIAAVEALHADVGSVLARLAAELPLAQWVGLAQAGQAGLLPAGFQPVRVLAGRVFPPPGRAELAALVAAGAAWGEAPTMLVARRYHVSPTTARRWLSRSRVNRSPLT